VSPITAKDIREFYEIKSVLESHAARLAVGHISEQQIARMESLNRELERLYREADISGMIPVHNEFHEVFVRACGNDRLSSLIRALVKQFLRFRIALSHTKAVEDSIKLHDEIIAAFRRRDAEAVSLLVAQNSSEGGENLIENLKAA
jgi:DNA-binding GntR family transcriptional regulator